VSSVDRFLFSRFGFATAFKEHKCDLAFIPWVTPFPAVPSVITVHDLVPLLSIAPVGLQSKINFSLFAHHYVKRASCVLANSCDTKRAIVEICKIAPEKIQVVPLGIDKELFYVRTEAEVVAVKVKHSLPRPYFISVASSWQPRKNLGRLIEAFAHFSLRHPGIDLVITGRRGPSYPEMRQLIAKHQLERSVHLLEFVPIEDLPPMLSGAVSLVFPSIHEGFGLPVLEAMGCGCLAIISHVGALPEVGGDAALYIDPLEIDSLSSAMEKVVSDTQLRSALSQKSLQRASHFSWENTARLTLKAFQEVS
jgi:glycosyltransferase involved in cell wall biosynthesis